MNFELSEEQIMFRDMARRIAEEEMLPTLKQHERERTINWTLYKKLGEAGLIGAHLPVEYGGLGLDFVTCCIIWEQLSWASWTQMLCATLPGVLPGTIITAVGTEEQKQKYLPPTCRAEICMAVAAVEPTAGSDATNIHTMAVLDGNKWVINGTKLFITCGSIADVVLVLVQTDVSKGNAGLAMIAVEKGTPGFTAKPIHMVGGWADDTANLRFDDVRVPKENLIGAVGRGIQNAIIGIDTMRCSISAGSIGMSQSCLDACVKYAKERQQFGKPLAKFQMMQDIIATMQAEIESTRWEVWYAADLKSRGLPHVKEMSAAKYLATELAVRTSYNAIRLHGAYGTTDDFPVEHHYRDAALTTILGGVTEIHKLMIGRELLNINAMV